MNLRSAVITSVYFKSLSLSSAALARRSAGEISNLMSVDSARLQDLTPYLHALWYSFFQVTVAMTMLWRQLGLASIAGACFFLL
jgi:ATP-binding cassette, subfamily C (CFTR/MRP), member 1